MIEELKDAEREAFRELHEAARQFYNLTIGDSAVLIRAYSAEKRDAITAAGELLRALLKAGAKP
jgi:hypothetical protein